MRHGRHTRILRSCARLLPLAAVPTLALLLVASPVERSLRICAGKLGPIRAPAAEPYRYRDEIAGPSKLARPFGSDGTPGNCPSIHAAALPAAPVVALMRASAPLIESLRAPAPAATVPLLEFYPMPAPASKATGQAAPEARAATGPAVAPPAPIAPSCGNGPEILEETTKLRSCAYWAAGQAYSPTGGGPVIADRYHSKGRCYVGVKLAMSCAHLATRADFARSPSRGVSPSEAHTAGLLRRLGFKNVYPELARCYGAGPGQVARHASPGSILVYEGGPYGHIEVKVGERQYCSDFCNWRSVDLNSNVEHRRRLIAVYVPDHS